MITEPHLVPPDPPDASIQDECAAIGHELFNGKCRFCGYVPPAEPR